MTLSKPFDGSALLSSLKAAGIADAEKIINDALPVIFDWLNSSVTLEAANIPLLAVATPVLEVLESKATAAVQALEKQLGG